MANNEMGSHKIDACIQQSDVVCMSGTSNLFKFLSVEEERNNYVQTD